MQIFDDNKNNKYYRARQATLGTGLEVVEDDTGLPLIRVHSGEITTLMSGIIPDECIPVNAPGGWLFEMTAQPAARTWYELFQRPWYDASKYTDARLVVDVYSGGATNSVLELEYSLEGITWTAAGSTTPVTAPLAASGAIRGPFQPLVSGALADVAWRVVAVSGDGATSPIVGFVGIEFTLVHYPQPELVPLYFRSTTATNSPAVTPGYPSDIAVQYDFWGDGVPAFYNTAYAGTRTFPSPNIDSIIAAPKSLLLSKGSSTASLSFDVTPSDGDEAGLIGRFLSPRMAAGTLYPYTGSVQFSAQFLNGSGAAYFFVRLGVVRGSTVLAVKEIRAGSAWARYATRDRIIDFTWPTTLTLQNNDRFFVDVFATTAMIGLVLFGYGGSFNYNDINDVFVEDSYSVGRPGSFIEIPDYITFLDTSA